jgi:aminotransferase
MKDLSEAILNSKKSSIRKLFELVLKAKNAVSFGIGQPNFPTPDHVTDAIIKALRDKKTQYAPTLGLPKLRELVANKFKEENKIEWAEAKNIIVTNGGSHALQLAYAVLSNPGDEIIVSSPNFLSYYYLASFYQLKTVEVPRKTEDFSPDLEKIRKSVTDKTKFIIINSPNNPTGYTYTKKQMDEIVQIVLENNLYLISDEVYEKFVYENCKHISPASYDEMADRTLTLNAMSKTFGATGLRVGYIAANDGIIGHMEKYAQYCAAGVNHPTQYGGIAAMEKGNPEMEKIIEAYNKKRQYCVKRLKELDFDFVEPYGAFYIMPSVAKFASSSEEFAENLMKQQEVAVVPGGGFGSYSKDYIRISYATEDKNLKKGFNRIEKYIKSLN